MPRYEMHIPPARAEECGAVGARLAEAVALAGGLALGARMARRQHERTHALRLAQEPRHRLEHSAKWKIRSAFYITHKCNLHAGLDTSRMCEGLCYMYFDSLVKPSLFCM